MKIGILHFTDLHFEEKGNFILERNNQIESAFKISLSQAERIYIIISGDIVNKGLNEGYKNAQLFIERIILGLEKLIPKSNIKLIIVPGNHDCNFKYNSQLRENAVNTMCYQTIGDKDDTVIDLCLDTQKDFWKFYSKFNSLPENKLFYQIKDEFVGGSINFNCINTSWSSKQKEDNNLFFPVKKFDKSENFENGSLNISVFHHPVTWFTPSGEQNHRKEFQTFVEDNNSLIIYGHEHEEQHIKTTELLSEKESLYISGRLLQNHYDKEDSGFQTILINAQSKKGKVYNYLWDTDLYKLHFEKEFKLNGEHYSHKRFKHNIDYINKINTVNIPLTVDNNSNVKLSDFYVFPDIDNSNFNNGSKNSYYDSEKLVNEKEFSSCIIEGENQSGKTSLISMLYLKFVEKDKYPLYVDCTSITSQNLDKTLRKSFDKQYKSEKLDYERFTQYDISKKIILLDNLQDLQYNSKTIIRIISELELKFGKLIIVTNTLFSLISIIESEFKNLVAFKIKPLGYKKRNQLIENYHRLSLSVATRTDEILLAKTKASFNQVEMVLGNKLMPSYPSFVLSILQTLVYAKPTNLEQTSYGYCYHSLIHIALVKNGNINNEYIDTFFNFLSEFSLNLFESNKSLFTEKEFEDYFNIYKSNFHVTFSFDTLKKAILDSKLIVIEDDILRFSYDYIFYFLVARKISEIITKQAGKDIIKKLCSNLHKQENANILVFISHHTKDDYLIEEATFTSMIPFETLKPITLEVHGEYYEMLKDIVKEISSDVIENSSNPIESRELILEKKDKIEVHESRQKKQKKELDDNELASEIMSPISQSFRAIEIVGQIIRNRKGSIPSEQLISMIVELYNTAFRTISYFGVNLRNGKEEFIESFLSQIDDTDTKHDVKERINSFFQFISLKICLDVFSKIIYSVGQKDLRDLYTEAAKRINTPAADIVTFSINSYYGNMSKVDLQIIVKKYEKNPVAMEIIKKRVQSYLYQNFVDYRKRQSFASTLNMKMIPQKNN
jgi:hypothetical protein